MRGASLFYDDVFLLCLEMLCRVGVFVLFGDAMLLSFLQHSFEFFRIIRTYRQVHKLSHCDTVSSQPHFQVLGRRLLSHLGYVEIPRPRAIRESSQRMAIVPFFDVVEAFSFIVQCKRTHKAVRRNEGTSVMAKEETSLQTTKPNCFSRNLLSFTSPLRPSLQRMPPSSIVRYLPGACLPVSLSAVRSTLKCDPATAFSDNPIAQWFCFHSLSVHLSSLHVIIAFA